MICELLATNHPFLFLSPAPPIEPLLACLLKTFFLSFLLRKSLLTGPTSTLALGLKVCTSIRSSDKSLRKLSLTVQLQVTFPFSSCAFSNSQLLVILLTLFSERLVITKSPRT